MISFKDQAMSTYGRSVCLPIDTVPQRMSGWRGVGGAGLISQCLRGRIRVVYTLALGCDCGQAIPNRRMSGLQTKAE